MFQYKQILGAGPMLLLFFLPLASSLSLLLPGLVDVESFSALLVHPQFFAALLLTLFTGVASTVLALILAVFIMLGAGRRVFAQAGVFLALPHLALALGLGFLLAPTGVLARLLAGGVAPPDWQLVQDPWGFGLIIALVLKETPFLVWAMASVLQGDELRRRLQLETIVARSLGHGPRSTYFKVVLPQLLQRSIWPLVAVFSYGLTVVDVALAIGPAQPPTLAQLIWTDLNDGEPLSNARGAAGTLLLSFLIVLLLLATWALLRILKPTLRRLLTLPASSERQFHLSRSLWPAWLVIYGLVILALVLQSVSLHWPYPDLLATAFSPNAWLGLLNNLSPLVTSLVMAGLTSTIALIAVVMWFETQEANRDRWALVAATLMLCIPALLVSLGQYRLLLQLGLTGTGVGLFSAHVLPVMAYVFVMLLGPYRSYDSRWQMVAQGLGVTHMKFLTDVKWPMLKSPLLSALAIGFAVSVAQYVPAQLAAAGRFSTLPMEAVTLSTGGNRALISVYALVLMLLPLIGFWSAVRLSKSRWRDA